MLECSRVVFRHLGTGANAQRTLTITQFAAQLALCHNQLPLPCLVARLSHTSRLSSECLARQCIPQYDAILSTKRYCPICNGFIMVKYHELLPCGDVHRQPIQPDARSDRGCLIQNMLKHI